MSGTMKLAQPHPAGKLFPSRIQWISLVALAAYIAILFVDVPLLDPDEGLHAAIAQEMVDTGDWVTPRILGEPFLDKPILYFWALCTSLSLFGSNEFAIRLPGIFFALLSIAGCWYAARLWFDRRAALFATCIQATTLLPFAASQAAVHDVPLATWTIASLIALWSIPTDPTTSSRLWMSVLASSLFLGLAILTKGMVGVAFVMLAYVPAALLTRRLPFFRHIRLLALIGTLACIVASPWFLWMEWRNPGYLHYYFYIRHIVGFLAPTKWHGTREWWYYLPILLGGGLPWTPYLCGAVRQFFTDHRNPTSLPGQAERILLWCWLIIGILFLSTAKAKLASYCLPLFPPIALLVADLWDRGLNGELHPTAWTFQRYLAATLTLLAPLAAPLIWIFAISQGFAPYSTFGLAVGLIVTMVSAAAIRHLVHHDWERIFTGGILSIATLSIGTILVFLPSLAEQHSGRILAAYLNEHFSPDGELILFRERIGSVLFYLKPEIRHKLTTSQMQTNSIRKFIETFSAKEHQLVVIPEREVPLILHYVEFSHLPYESYDRYRIYRGTGFVPLHVRRIPPAQVGIMAN